MSISILPKGEKKLSKMCFCCFLVCQLSALQYMSEAAVVINGVGSLGHCPAGPMADRQIQNLFSPLSLFFFFAFSEQLDWQTKE